MLKVTMGGHKTCDGVSRRDFLRVGALSFVGLAGGLVAAGIATALFAF